MTDIQSDLPDGWVWTTIGEIAELNKRPIQLAELQDNDEVAFVPMSAVNAESGAIDQAIVRPLGEVKRGYSAFADNDVLFAKITPSMENGKAAIAHTLPNGIGFGSTEFHVIRPFDGVLSNWVFHFVRRESFRSDAKANFSGTAGQLRVPQNFVVDYPFPLAPLNEQRRIVDAIESYFTRLDAAEAALRRAQARLAQYKTALLKAACEGRLVPTEAELARQEGRAYEPAQVLLARVLKERRAKWEAEEWARLVARARQRAAAEAGKAEWLDLSEIVYARYLPKDDKWKEKYQEPVAPDLDGLPELPEGWCWSSLGRTYPISVGSTPSRAHPEYWDGDVPWVSSGEVAFCRIRSTRERISELGLKNSSTVVHPIGTVMLGMIGEGRTRGQAAILDIAACHNQNSAAIRVSEVGMPPEYVYYYLYSRYEETRRGSSGNNQLALNRSRVQSIQFPLPPLAEQERIVAEVERRLSLVDALETALAANLTRAARLRQAILRRAFAGQLVPQDANDEPAAVLLERIRDCRGAPLRLPVSRRGS